MGRKKIIFEAVIGSIIGALSIQAGTFDPSAHVVELNEADNQFFSTERTQRESWYSKTLDLSMHLWADLDMLHRNLTTLLPDHVELIFNASLGKLTHLQWCLRHLLPKNESQTDDLNYLVRIIKSVEDLCTKLTQQSFLAHRIESTQELLRGITAKIDTAFFP